MADTFPIKQHYRIRTRIISSMRKTPMSVWILLGVVGCVLIVTIPEFFAPISGDTAIYAYISKALTRGEVLYRDIWDFKAPGIYLLFAFVFEILPDTLLSLRSFAFVWSVLAGISFWILARRLFSLKTTLSITIPFMLWTNLAGKLNGDGPFPETFMPLFSIWVCNFWISYQESREKKWLYLAGLASACLFLLKQTAIASLVVILFALVMEKDFSQLSWKRIATGIGIYFLGVMTLLIPLIMYFFFVDAIDDLWNAVVLHPVIYAQTTPIKQQVLNALNLFINMFPALSLLYFLVPLGYWKVWSQSKQVGINDQKTRLLVVLAIWGVVELLSIALPGRYYERYLLQPLVPLLIVAGLSIENLFSMARELSILRSSYSYAFCVALFISLFSQLPRTLHWIDDRILTTKPTRSELIADYMKNNSDETDTVFAWGDPRIPFVANRLSQKWINTEPFFTSEAFVSIELVHEILVRFQENPPQFFIESTARPRFANSYLGSTPVAEFIQSHYRFVIQISDAEIYEYVGNIE